MESNRDGLDGSENVKRAVSNNERREHVTECEREGETKCYRVLWRSWKDLGTVVIVRRESVQVWLMVKRRLASYEEELRDVVQRVQMVARC